MFVDECDLTVRSGPGGNGVVAFLREKFRPWGGPAGGDGGKGGDVIFEATRNEGTLLFLARQRKIAAAAGVDGQNKKMAGISAPDVVVAVPIGTVVKDRASGQVLYDFTAHGQREVICRGGQGGFGNSHYATAIHRTPRRAEPGQPGEERRLKLELKLIADVGLAGLPNAGKSSLLARLSAARPKIADYPFTTLAPMVGVVDAGQGNSFVLADIPGLIEGAHEGKGLGIQFLKHIERTRVILHMVDLYPPDGSDPYKNFQTIRAELAEYSTALAERPALLAANKIDLAPDEKALRKLKRQVAKGAPNMPVFGISCATGAGLPALVQALHERIQQSILPAPGWSAPAREPLPTGAREPLPVPKPAPLPAARPVPPRPPQALKIVSAMPAPVDPEHPPLAPDPSPKELRDDEPRPDLRSERSKAPPGVGRRKNVAPFQRKGRRHRR
ncbi:MAG: GTPase ObgE [Planctomycetota bacterium]